MVESNVARRHVLVRHAAWSVASVLLLCSTPLAAQQMPDSVRQYVSDAIAIFRASSVHRDEVNWSALEDSVIARAGAAQTPAATWRALTLAFRGVDRHSFLMPPASAMQGMIADQKTRATSRPSRPLGRVVDGTVGLIAVPAHGGPNRPAYVDSIQAQLKSLDSAGVCGWVVDLRDNTGGNMWPMLAGIGPLLGAEVVGSFTNGKVAEWRYRDGRAWSGGSIPPDEPSGWGTGAPYRVQRAEAPVALLLSRRTASSGELTLLAFLGRPNVRTFGDTTAGYNSSNSSIPLRDGATLVVTSGYGRDRTGRSYPLSLAPDEFVRSGMDTATDVPLGSASAWVRRQPACTARE